VKGKGPSMPMERPRMVALSLKYICNLSLRHAEVVLPSGISRVGLGETVNDLIVATIFSECLCELALSQVNITDEIARDCEVPLPSGISRVGLGDAFSDGQRGLVGGERIGEVALDFQDLANSLLRDGQVALPCSIPGVSFGDRPCDRDGRFKEPAGFEKVALRLCDIAQTQSGPVPRE